MLTMLPCQLLHRSRGHADSRISKMLPSLMSIFHLPVTGESFCTSSSDGITRFPLRLTLGAVSRKNSWAISPSSSCRKSCAYQLSPCKESFLQLQIDKWVEQIREPSRRLYRKRVPPHLCSPPPLLFLKSRTTWTMKCVHEQEKKNHLKRATEKTRNRAQTEILYTTTTRLTRR